MELLRYEAPIIYWLITTLWEIIVIGVSCLVIFLCIALAVCLFNRAKAC